MGTNNDGGPAFPVSDLMRADGMSLRDYLAAHAPPPTLAQIEAQQSYDRTRNPHNDSHRPRIRDRHEIIAYLMYQHADAMLAARGAA